MELVECAADQDLDLGCLAILAGHQVFVDVELAEVVALKYEDKAPRGRGLNVS